MCDALFIGFAMHVVLLKLCCLQIIPHSDSVDLHSLLTSTQGGRPECSQLVTISGSDHGYSKPEHTQAAVEQVKTWLMQQFSVTTGKASSL